MIFLVLFLLSFFAILFTVGFGIVIAYHFERFGVKDDPNAKRMLSIFRIGGAILIGLNIILLLLTFLKR